MLQSLLVLHLAAGFGPEITVAAPGQNARAANLQYRPDVASDGTDFVIVWIDKRREDGTHSTYGARVRRDGLLLDPVGIPLGPVHSEDPRVAYLGGNRYVIVWSIHGDIEGRILRGDGTWEGPAFTVGTGNCPAVAGADGTFAVAWSGGSVFSRRYHADAGRLDPVPQQLAPGASPSVCPLIAPGVGPQEWTVTWSEPRQLLAAFLASGGGSTATSIMMSLQTELALRGQVHLSDGRSWVAWSSRFDSDLPVFGVTVSPAGLATVSPVWPGDGGVWDTAFTVGSDGLVRGFLSVGQYARDGFAALHVPLDGGAPLPGPSGRDYPGEQPALAASSDRLLLATSRYDEIAYVVTDQAFTVIDAGIASMSGAGQHELALAASGSSYLAAWSENAAVSSNVIARRLGPDAMPTGATLVLSATGTSPSVAYVPGMWAAAWNDQGGARFQLLTEPGVRGAAGRLRHGSAQSQMPHVIADGPRFAVVFVSNDDAAIYFAALELDGGVPSTSRVGSGPTGFPYLPRLARGDGGYLVVWQQNDDIRGARLDALGQSLDPTGFEIAAGVEEQFQPEVAFDGEAYVVGYRDYTFTRYVRVRGTQVGAPYMPFTPGPAGTMRRSALVSQPGGVLAAVCDTSGGDVFAKLLSPAGDGLDAGTQLVVAASPPFACEPAVAGAGDVLFGYGRFESAPQAMSAKVKLHRGGLSGASCTESWRCASGLCRNGVCDAPAGAGGGGGASGPSALAIGCGCSSGSGPLLLALLWLAWSRRRRLRATT